jgi:hypothetical protein
MDYFEVMGFSDHLIHERDLGTGCSTAACASRRRRHDAMANTPRCAVGRLVRVFVQTGPRFDHPTFLAA